MFIHEEWMFMWEHEFWMIKHENIIKLKNINEIDVSVMFDYFRMSNEKLITDYTRLLIRWHNILFKKMLWQIINIYIKRVDPCGVYPNLLYNDYLSLHLLKQDVKLKNH